MSKKVCYDIPAELREKIKVAALAVSTYPERDDRPLRDALEVLLRQAGVLEEGFELGPILEDMDPGEIDIIANCWTDEEGNERDDPLNYSSTIVLATGEVYYWSSSADAGES